MQQAIEFMPSGAARRQPDLCRSGAALTGLLDQSRAACGTRLVNRRRPCLESRQAPDGIPRVRPREFSTLDGAIQIQRCGPAIATAGVPTADAERRRTHRARVRCSLIASLLSLWIRSASGTKSTRLRPDNSSDTLTTLSRVSAL